MMTSTSQVNLIECPRDAMQGWPTFIPTHLKVEYLNALLKVGFHTLDFGSFVSAKAIPQMRDTIEVLEALDITSSNSTKLLAIVANEKGALNALNYEQIDYLGYPFSISETFQQNNTHSGIEKSFILVKKLAEYCSKKDRNLVVYLSMAFGNPYGDRYSESLVTSWAKKLFQSGIEIMYLADTVGNAQPADVHNLFTSVKAAIPLADLGLHLHASPKNAPEMISASIKTGCKRIDSSIRGLGGCPFASDELTGNLPTEHIISFLESEGIPPFLNKEAYKKAFEINLEVFH